MNKYYLETLNEKIVFKILKSNFNENFKSKIFDTANIKKILNKNTRQKY